MHIMLHLNYVKGKIRGAELSPSSVVSPTLEYVTGVPAVRVVCVRTYNEEIKRNIIIANDLLRAKT